MGFMWRKNPHLKHLLGRYGLFELSFGVISAFAVVLIIYSPYLEVEYNCFVSNLALILFIGAMTIITTARRTAIDARHPAYDLVILTGISRRRLLGGYIISESVMYTPFSILIILLPVFVVPVLLFDGFVPHEYERLATGLAMPALWLFALMMGISTGLAFRRPVMAVSVGLTMYGLAFLLWTVLLMVLTERVDDVMNDSNRVFRFRFIAEWFFLTALIPYVFLFITTQVAYDDVGRPNTSLDDFVYEDEEW